MYYLTSVVQVKEELRRRRRQQRTIRTMLDQHVEQTFGIANYSQFVREGIGSGMVGSTPTIDDEKSYGVLARQIPGMCSEDVACYLLSRRLGLVPSVLAFTRDSFNSGSNDKLFRARVPFISWSKKARLIVENRNLITAPEVSVYDELNMARMDRLYTDGISLAEYHWNMQRNVFRSFPEPYLWTDLSHTYGRVLAEVKRAGKQPATVWRSNREGKDEPSPCYTESEALDLTVRPSSKWYYHLYLSMFLDGTFVLLETYDNETGGVPEARRLFEREMDVIRSATGFMPMVVKTAPLRPDMLYVNQHIIDEPTRAGEQLCRMQYWSDETATMTRWLADETIRFGRPV